jgi:hypothetical protein
MAGLFRHKRDESCSQGVGDRLVELWKKVRLKVTSFAGFDDKPEERELFEQRELEDDEEINGEKASSTPHGQRSRRRRADEAPESPLPTDTAAFD